MRFFWFDWDDPKGSVKRGAFLVVFGLVAVVLFQKMNPEWLSRFSYLVGIAAFAYASIFVGALTVALGVGSWLFGSHRK